MKAESDVTPPNMKEIIEEIRGSLIEINPAKVLLMQVRAVFSGFHLYFLADALKPRKYSFEQL